MRKAPVVRSIIRKNPLNNRQIIYIRLTEVMLIYKPRTPKTLINNQNGCISKISSYDDLSLASRSHENNVTRFVRLKIQARSGDIFYLGLHR